MITLEHTNKILEDVEVVSDIAANRSRDLDGIIENVSESASSLSEAVKGNQNIAKAASGIVNATASCVGIVKGKKADK